nr:beta-lactamase domain-containing protein 2-like [Tanacetum cinerariifolium]
MQILIKCIRNDEKILGIQVAAYKDGKVIIDTAAGVLGKDDPRPVQPSSLFPLFSVTKGVTAGMVHWLADKGKLKLDENVANFWPEFGTNGKEQVKHASGKSLSTLSRGRAVYVSTSPIPYTMEDECSNCKHLRRKISVLKATMNMHMHPEQHTVNSAALLHEVLNKMEKLDLEEFVICNVQCNSYDLE